MSSSGTEFGLRDPCIVPWDDGTYYSGKIIKILDPADGCLHEDLGSHSKKPREVAQAFKVLRRSKSNTIEPSLIDECESAGEPLYYIHFRGWRSDTDEWLDVSRMLPHTPENVEMMQNANAEIKKKRALEKELEKQARQAASKKPASKQPAKQDTGKPGAEKLRSKDSSSTSSTSTSTSSSSTSSSIRSGAEKRKALDTDELNNKRSKTAVKQEQEDPSIDPANVGKRATRKARVGLSPAVVDLTLQLPLKLKRMLVSDWQLVTQDCLLVQLPRKISVVQILREFREHQLSSKTEKATETEQKLGVDPTNSTNSTTYNRDPLDGDLENMDMFVESMTTYFDYALGFLLLYRYERNQYYNVLHDFKNMKPSTVYGGEHLLRLIISMPTILAKDTVIDDITVQYVLKQLNLLTEFISSNSARFLGSIETYESPTRFYEAISSSANDEELQQQYSNDVNA